jgi:hypothetical protein
MKKASPPWVKALPPPPKQETDFDYHGAAWRKDADAHKAAFPYCAHCKKNGKIRFGRTSDHIVSVKNGGDPWDWRNRQNLCKEHDDKKRSEESRGIIPPFVGEWGKRLPIE